MYVMPRSNASWISRRKPSMPRSRWTWPLLLPVPSPSRAMVMPLLPSATWSLATRRTLAWVGTPIVSEAPTAVIEVRRNCRRPMVVIPGPPLACPSSRRERLAVKVNGQAVLSSADARQVAPQAFQTARGGGLPGLPRQPFRERVTFREALAGILRHDVRRDLLALDGPHHHRPPDGVR